MDINWIVDSPFAALPSGDPDHVALSVDAKEPLTYRELRDQRNRYVNLLLESGITAGDRVGIMLLNSIDYVAQYFAITRIGAVAVRLNFRLTSRELEFILQDAGCSVVFFHTTRADQLDPLHDSVGVRRWIAVDDGASLPSWASRLDLDGYSKDDADLPRPSGDQAAMLMYTSGTTGRPKGALWTHDNTLWAASAQNMHWRIDGSAVSMTTGPLFHVGAFETMLLGTLLMHGTGVITSSGGLTLDRTVSVIRDGGVTHIVLYPFALYELLRDPDLNLDDLSSLKVIMCGGDAVQPWALKAVDDKLPWLELQQGYGLTEGGSVVTLLDHAARLENPDSVGRPLPLTEVKTMIDPSTPTGPNEVGEVWVRSSAACAQYWNRPEASAETFVDGWCRTGDLGRISDSGYLALTGRAKDMIRSGGENIYPAEIEQILSSQPGVAAIAVVAVPDAKFVEVGCAVITTTEDADDVVELEAALRIVARRELAGYKGPKHYVFIEEMPLTQSGKIQKNVLRERYASLGTQPGQDS